MPPMCGPPVLGAISVFSNGSVGILVLGAVGGFVLGSMPFAYWIGRARGIDLRSVGSGNVGATNLGRNAGFSFGLLAFFLDAAKGALPVAVLGYSGGDEGTQVLAGGAAVLGHCFSPVLRFRGGKGVATMAGVLIALSPIHSGVLVAVWGGALAVLRNVGVSSSLAAAVGLGIGVWILATPQDPARPEFALLLIVLGLLLILRHRSNLQRYFSTPVR